MNIFRVILAFLFSLLIIGGIWKYYVNNDDMQVQDPFKKIWSSWVNYDEKEVVTGTQQLLDDLPSTDSTTISGDTGSIKVHRDFSFGILHAGDLDRLTHMGVLGGSPNGHLLWLHYCDFDAKYCQKSYEEGIVYDYLEAYPTELSYIYKPFPPTMLEHDLLPHRAALCAMTNGTSKQFFSFYDALYANNKDLSINELIGLGRSLGIDDMGNCLDTDNFDLVIQQETKLAKKLFNIEGLPANIFINQDTLKWVLVPGYYDSKDVLSALHSIE